MPLTITGELASPAAFGKAIKRFGRKQTSIKLRQAGEFALAEGQRLAGSELGVSGNSGSRRRNKGVSYRSGFEAEYTGLADFESGIMQVTLRNRSRHARFIEGGTRSHDIFPRNKQNLAWPPDTIIWPKGAGVHHPGTRAYRILERAVRRAMATSLNGTLGHARIRISVSGRRR